MKAQPFGTRTDPERDAERSQELEARQMRKGIIEACSCTQTHTHTNSSVSLETLGIITIF